MASKSKVLVMQLEKEMKIVSENDRTTHLPLEPFDVCAQVSGKLSVRVSCRFVRIHCLRAHRELSGMTQSQIELHLAGLVGSVVSADDSERRIKKKVMRCLGEVGVEVLGVVFEPVEEAVEEASESVVLNEEDDEEAESYDVASVFTERYRAMREEILDRMRHGNYEMKTPATPVTPESTEPNSRMDAFLDGFLVTEPALVTARCDALVADAELSAAATLKRAKTDALHAEVDAINSIGPHVLQVAAIEALPRFMSRILSIAAPITDVADAPNDADPKRLPTGEEELDQFLARYELLKSFSQ